MTLPPEPTAESRTIHSDAATVEQRPAAAAGTVRESARRASQGRRRRTPPVAATLGSGRYRPPGNSDAGPPHTADPPAAADAADPTQGQQLWKPKHTRCS